MQIVSFGDSVNEISGSVSKQVPRVLAVLTILITGFQVIRTMGYLEYACDPREAKVKCLLGCLSCFEYYGGQMYNMAACCQECKDTMADLIDDGPVKCSQRFIKMSWMRRFGK